jgi:hypothetical protein
MHPKLTLVFPTYLTASTTERNKNECSKQKALDDHKEHYVLSPLSSSCDGSYDALHHGACLCQFPADVCDRLWEYLPNPDSCFYTSMSSYLQGSASVAKPKVLEDPNRRRIK